jgi:beta-lactamase regulating signal transducer with metallopeptidase domain
MAAGCFVFGEPPFGIINDWLCNGGRVLAIILTPLFAVVLILAIAKAILSIYATYKITTRYGYAAAIDYPRLFFLTEKLCGIGNIKIPRIIVTGDAFSRCYTMGYRAPVIVLSQGLLAAMDDEELETVIAHELGHIARADSVFTWFTVLLRDMMFFSPLVYWIFRGLAAEREKAADDIAIKLTKKPLAFAQALIKAWRLSPSSFMDTIMLDNFMPHPNFAGQAGILEFRVRRILAGDHGPRGNTYLGYAAILIICFLTVVVLSWFC